MEIKIAKIVLFVLAGFAISWLLSFTPLFDSLFDQYKQLIGTLLGGGIVFAIYTVPVLLVGWGLLQLIQQHGIARGIGKFLLTAFYLVLFFGAMGVMIMTPIFLAQIPWVDEHIPLVFIFIGGYAIGSLPLWLAYRIMDGPDKTQRED